MEGSNSRLDPRHQSEPLGFGRSPEVEKQVKSQTPSKMQEKTSTITNISRGIESSRPSSLRPLPENKEVSQERSSVRQQGIRQKVKGVFSSFQARFKHLSTKEEESVKREIDVIGTTSIGDPTR